jgi:hypothetical protein
MVAGFNAVILMQKNWHLELQTLIFLNNFCNNFAFKKTPTFRLKLAQIAKNGDRNFDPLVSVHRKSMYHYQKTNLKYVHMYAAT